MLGIGIDTSIASANEVEEAIEKQQEIVDNPQVQKLSKALDAPVENIMDKAVGYIKSQSDKKKAFAAIRRSMVTNSLRSKWLDSRSSCDEHERSVTGAGGKAPPLLLLSQVCSWRHASLGDVHAGQLKKESDALTFGTLYDMMLFEPEKAHETYFVLDDSDIVADIGGKNPRSTKRYKEWKAEQIGEALEQGTGKSRGLEESGRDDSTSQGLRSVRQAIRWGQVSGGVQRRHRRHPIERIP